LTQPTSPGQIVGGNISLVANTTATDVEWCLFEYRSESGSWTILLNDTDGSDNWTAYMNTTEYLDGDYELRATMGDGVNNTNVTLSSLTIDNTAPIITLVTPTAGMYISNDFTLVAEIDELYMDRVEFWGSLDNVVWNLFYTDDDGSDGWTMEVNLTGANQGHHWIEIIAYDTVGHNGTADWDAYVDTNAPEVAINSPSTGDYLAGTVTINASASDEISGIDYAAIIYDNGISTAEIYNSTPASDMFETNWDTTSYDDGEATLTLVSIDIAGLMNSTSITVTLDNTDPIADAGDDATIDVGTDFVFNGTGSSDNLGILSYEWTFVYDGTDQSLTGMSPSFTFDIAGEYEVTLTVTDQVGNTATDTIMVNVTVTIELPTVVDTDPAHNSTQVPVTTTVTITFSLPMNITSVENALVISPSVGSTLTWNQDNTTLTITFTTVLTDNTTYTITIGVDAEGIAGGLLQDTPYAFEFTTAPIPPPPPNTRPVLTQGEISPATGDTDTEFTFTVTYTDADNDPGDVWVWIDGANYTMTPDPDDTDYTDGVEYTYQAKLSEGDHSYYFTANDGTDDAESGDTTPTTTADADDTPTISKTEDKEAGFEDWMLYLILIIIIIIIIVILLLAMSRRKPTEEELLAAEEEELAAEEEPDDMDLVAGEDTKDEDLGDDEEDEDEE
ncbi:MAG: Ig-like domain-containing protein, partial [Thermoplasmata archaeon]|nr:Ig-like domain-containing protein [Thermoplasmata archaeon]